MMLNPPQNMLDVLLAALAVGIIIAIGVSFRVNHIRICGQSGPKKEKGENMDITLVPKNILENLLEGETILAAAQQSKIKHPVNPETGVVTSQRVMWSLPSALGLRAKIGELDFRELGKVDLKKGIVFSAVYLADTDGQLAYSLLDISKDEAVEFANAARQQVRNAKLGKGDAVGRVLTTQVAIQPAQPSNDPLAKLKMRLANGEITAEQYKELSGLLNG